MSLKNHDNECNAMPTTAQKMTSRSTATTAAAAADRQIGSNKIFIIAALLVLATFPQSTEEFSFGFGFGGGGDGEMKNAEKAVDVANKRAPVRRERKFKFHKIERTYEDGDVNENSNDDEDEENENGNNNGKIKATSAKKAKAAASNDDEEQQYEFERIRKAEKSTRKSKKQKAAAAADDDDDTESSFFGSLFGGSSKSSEKSNTQKSESSNGIIDWILWLGERSGRLKEEATPPSPTPTNGENGDESWLSYLDRWPFNVLFPIGKNTKAINMPRKAKLSRTKNTADDASSEEPMSEANFNYLLHTLPAFVINASHVAWDLECRQHMQVFQRQLRGKKLWTLQMLDSTGKITSGLLRGNINRFGDFDLCTQVKAAVKITSDHQMRIRGKYCLAHIEADTDEEELKPAVHLAHGRGLFNSHLGNPGHFLARYTVANWGVCIPHICPASVVQEMLLENLKPYNRSGIEFHVEVDDNDCAMRPTKSFFKLFKKEKKFFLTSLYMLVHLMFVMAALAYDFKNNLKVFFNGLYNKFLKSKVEEKTAEQAEEATNAEDNAKEESEAAAEAEAEPETEAGVKESMENPSISSDLPTEKEEESNDSTNSQTFKQLLLSIFLSYSPRRTLTSLLSVESNDMEFPIFHILKLIATLMLYVCLKFMMIGHLPISNRDKLVQFVEKPYSVFFRVPMIYADILLLLSGFMVAYQLSEEMAEKRFIHFLKRLVAKVTRYLPTTFLVLAFQTWILPQLGTGPLWSNLIGQHAQICEQQMWRNALSLQNAIDFEDTCSPFTVQLALQVQLFLLGPLIVWLYYTDADAGFFLYGALHALSVAARFSRTNREQLSMTLFHGMNVSKFYRSANLLYSSPISRATPYLLGIGFGILYRTQQGTLGLLSELVALGWTLSCLGLVWCFWSSAASSSTNFIYRANDAASYAAWSPLILGLALCWIIFMFAKSENSLLKFISTARPILFLSRISFPIQLVTYVVVLHSTAKVRETVKFHMTDLFDLNEIGAILFYAAILAFLLDVPIQQMRHIIIERLFIERSSPAEEPESGMEQSEPDTSEPDISEHQNNDNAKAACETPEPTETIWASDPEEEEQIYLNRRRSSVAPVESDIVEEIKQAASDQEAEEEDEKIEETEEAEIKRSPSPAKVIPRRRRRPSNSDE